MTTVKGTVIWGSKHYKIDINLSEPVSVVMKELEALTDIPVENQTLVMPRKPRLLPDASWPEGITGPIKVMLIGSPRKSIEEVKLFTETKGTAELEEASDEREESDPRHTLDMVGLRNEGNTCYISAVMQVLRNLPEFVSAVKSADPNSNKHTDWLIKFFNDPTTFWTALLVLFRSDNKTWRERDLEGAMVQQDAGEFWTYMMKFVRTHIGETLTDSFRIKYKVVQENTKTGETIELEEYDDKLMCSIDENVMQIEQGISMVSDVEKAGDDGSSVDIWTIRKQIVELPMYLTIQMLRFFYKSNEGHSVKLFRMVDHPKWIDLLPWAGDELKKQWVEKRENHKGRKKCRDAGFYRLKAIITHRGRTPESGHYVAWVNVNHDWIKYDDEKVEVVEKAQIGYLKGGADWHSNYILVYEKY